MKTWQTQIGGWGSIVWLASFQFMEYANKHGYHEVSNVYRSSYHLTPASNRCLVYATLVRTSFGINFRPFLNML